jgi:hypothetical protein
VLLLDWELEIDRLLELRLEILLLGILLLVELRLEIPDRELRLDEIELERLGEELRVEILELLLRLGALDAVDRLGMLRLAPLERELLMLEERDAELDAAVVRRLLLLLELLLFRELLDAQTGSKESAKIKMENTKKKEVVRLWRIPYF